jgi:hypothetical protein
MPTNQKSRRAKLDKLTPEQQEAVFAYCERATIVDGVLWVKETTGVKVGNNALSRWLYKQRAARGFTANLRKVRPDCILGMLTKEQQEVIEAHCTKLKVEEGAEWLRNEMKIEVSGNALATWLRKRQAEKAFAARLEEIRKSSECATLVANEVGAAAVLTEANIVLIAQVVFEELNKKPEERDEKRMAQYMKLALQGRSVSLAYDKFYFDAAKTAEERASELQAIREGDGDEREKLDKVIEILFGVKPARFVPSELSDPNGGGELANDAE